MKATIFTVVSIVAGLFMLAQTLTPFGQSMNKVTTALTK